MANQNDFDFDTYNKLTARIPAGLRIFLACQQMKLVADVLEMYDNPLSTDADGIYAEMKEFRVAYKAAAALIAEKKGMLASDGKSE